MNILIVGGGRVGRTLLEELEGESEVSIVELRSEVCEKIASSSSSLVIQGDGTNPSVLQEAGIESCDVLIAATADGKTNLVVCQLAKKYNNIKRRIARIVAREDEGIFEELGVSDAIWEVQAIVDMIRSSIFGVEALPVGERDMLIKVLVREKNPEVGKTIREIKFPKKGTLFLGIFRAGQLVMPSNAEIVAGGDILLFISHKENLTKFSEMFWR